jgi:hypothetical protein
MRKPKRSQAVRKPGRSSSRKEADIDTAAVPGAGAAGAAQVNASEPTARARRAEGAAGTRGVPPAASVDAIPSGPPPEVREQMAQAQRAYEQLADQGRSLHFGHDDAGRTTVEMRDSEGALVRTLTLSEVVDLASGRTAEQP